MVRTLHALAAAAAVLAALAHGRPAYGQAQTLPPPPVPAAPAPGPAAPAPVTLPLPAAVPPAPPVVGAPAPVLPKAVVVPGPPGGPPTPVAPPPPAPVYIVPPPPPPPCPLQDRNGPLLRGDPLLDRPPARPGWFGAFEVGLVVPHIKNRLTQDVPIAGTTDTVHLPTAELDWVGSPRVTLGYRLAEGCGEFLATYRSVVSDGSETIPVFDFLGAGFLHSRLNVNVLDLDYSSREFGLAPFWELQWWAGVRVAGVYFDSRAAGLFAEQRTSNNFVGAGPHAGLEVARCLPLPGLALFGRLDGAVLVGDVTQSYEEVLTFGPGSQLGGATRVESTQGVPVLGVKAGLSWTPYTANGRWLRFDFGYEFEQWWRVGEAAGSHATLTMQGLFFRGQFDF